MIDESDAMLVQRSLAGDATAARTLVDRYNGYVSVIIRGKGIRQDADVEDIRQNVWLAVYRALARYDEQYKFKSWLGKIASNATTGHMRKKGRKGLEFFPEGFEPSDESSMPGLQTEIFDMIVRLSEREQQIIRMNYLEEMSPGEIADRLGVSTWIVYRDRCDALGKLREMLLEANDLSKG
jgi:RNA polymerase sigma-70 factor (ECF subfamily)